MIFWDLRYVEQQLLIRIALNILKDINISIRLQWIKKKHYHHHRHHRSRRCCILFVCPVKKQKCTVTDTPQTTAAWLRRSERRVDRDRDSVQRLPCPSRSAGPTAWTPASRLRLGSRSDTAASPCRCAGTARIPGLSPRARVPPRNRSRVRVRDRVRVLTSWRSAQAVKPRHRCWVRKLFDPTTTLRKVRPYCAFSDFRVELQLKMILPVFTFSK